MSSFLLRHSVKQIYPAIIPCNNSLDKSIWLINIDKFTDGSIQAIIQIYRDIKQHLTGFFVV